MHPFAVIARVGQQSVNVVASSSGAHHVDHMRMIRARAAFADGCENQMTVAVANQADLRPTSIRRGLHGLTAFRASPYEVMAGVVRFESGAVDGRQLQAFLDDLRADARDKRLIKEAARGVFFSSRSAAFCSVV